MQELENWLQQVEQNLSDLPATSRSRIILDLDQKIRSHLGKGHPLDSVLSSFGSPEQVAARAKLELAAEPAVKPPRQSSASRFWKWATIILVGGFFGVIGLFILLPFLLFKLFTFNFFNKEMNFSLNHSVATARLTGTQREDGLQHFIFRASNGQLLIKSEGSTFIYNCKVSSSDRLVDDSALSRPNPTTLNFELTEATAGDDDKADCKLTVPSSASVEVELKNGQVVIENAQQDVNIHLQKGSIDFSKKADVIFEVSASASTGEIRGLTELNEKQSLLQGSQSTHHKANLKVDLGQIAIK
jgi:hypothetical protein